eukprot:TRINITY_DN23636_c0_g1_i1.p1 TRINITY_DN23636_c0_g1~~TRINITY_DN23636_c0_g1_i1.p1  ORF type:complete len:356 (+),score=25.91 TRINITY_DN23636_c0_g1_i1:37-1068(+)
MACEKQPPAPNVQLTKLFDGRSFASQTPPTQHKLLKLAGLPDVDRSWSNATWPMANLVTWVEQRYKLGRSKSSTREMCGQSKLKMSVLWHEMLSQTRCPLDQESTAGLNAFDDILAVLDNDERANTETLRTLLSVLQTSGNEHWSRLLNDVVIGQLQFPEQTTLHDVLQGFDDKVMFALAYVWTVAKPKAALPGDVSRKIEHCFDSAQKRLENICAVIVRQVIQSQNETLARQCCSVGLLLSGQVESFLQLNGLDVGTTVCWCIMQEARETDDRSTRALQFARAEAIAAFFEFLKRASLNKLTHINKAMKTSERYNTQLVYEPWYVFAVAGVRHPRRRSAPVP